MGKELAVAESIMDNEGTTLALEPATPAPTKSALATNFDTQIRPMLDTVDRIRTLGVMQEGIQLPTIVVVGDQSSGKSSVLESLAGITLPRGQGIATRVPLILRLQSCRSENEASITLEYKDVKKQIAGENEIEAAINAATDAIAGTNKGVSEEPISLHIRKLNAPDLTMIDLPGITRVPVHGQPENIYDQIASMIQHYITPKESIILNVLSATVDFPTCESVRMSQQADREGQRTLAVVTKVDKAPEGLHEKVTTDAVSIGLGYVCVRNRTDGEQSNEVARRKEKQLFDTHPALKKLDRSMVGIPTLAERLTYIQAQMVRGCLPKIFKDMSDVLYGRRQELNLLPKGVTDGVEAGVVFSQVQNKRMKTLVQLVREGNFESFPDEKRMHYTARLHELFQKFADDLHNAGLGLLGPGQVEGIVELLSEYQGVGLPDFLPHPVLHHLVKKQIDSISGICKKLVEDTHAYALEVVLEVNGLYNEGYPQIHSCYKLLAGEVLEDTKESSMQFVERMLEKERTIVFTTNHYYSDMCEKMRIVLDSATKDGDFHKHVQLNESGELLHLDEIKDKGREYQNAWRVKASMVAYWKVVQKRLADEIPLEIRYALRMSIVHTINDRMTAKAWSDGSVQSLMQESASLTQKRARLNCSIDVLQRSLALVSGFIG